MLSVECPDTRTTSVSQNVTDELKTSALSEVFLYLQIPADESGIRLVRIRKNTAKACVYSHGRGAEC